MQVEVRRLGLVTANTQFYCTSKIDTAMKQVLHIDHVNILLSCKGLVGFCSCSHGFHHIWCKAVCLSMSPVELKPAHDCLAQPPVRLSLGLIITRKSCIAHPAASLACFT